jgi:hypothetical protein
VSELTVEDFKQLLLDLYLAQRTAAELQFKLAEFQKEQRVDEEG